MILNIESLFFAQGETCFKDSQISTIEKNISNAAKENAKSGLPLTVVKGGTMKE